MVKTFCLVLIFAAVAFAGWERAIYSQSTSCSGEVDTTQVDDNKCGKSLNSDNYYVIFFDSGNKRYQINGYGSDSTCNRKLTSTTIDQDNLGKCIPLSNYGAISVGSQSIKFWVACFPGEATVEVEGGQTITLDQLKVGQKIASYRQGSSTPVYSEVYSFLDFDPNMSIKYRKIEFVGENNITGSISVSNDHLLLAKRTGAENFFYAKEIEVGDTIYHNQKGSVVPVLVSAISNKVSKGVYAPATMEGTVIIDGVVASSYASVAHSIGHAILAPLRWAYWLSPSLVKTDAHGLHPYTQTFYNWFSQFLMDPHSFIAPYSISN